jgi:tryptophan-rich sensory protein
MWSLILLIAVCLLTGVLGSLATSTSVNSWYVELSKPSWTPPSWVFGPAWTILYIMMAIAAWLVWRKGYTADVRFALTLFGVQLLVNGLWSYLFFGLRWPGGALVDIAVLWVAIAATAIAFSRVSPPAAWLLLPYLAWVSFAMALNLEIWRRNA